MFERCATCRHVDLGKALRQALEDAKKQFPPTITFYDFGDGVTTMPVPDPQTGSYLTSSASWFVELDAENPVPEKRLRRVLGFKYQIPVGSRGDEIYNQILKAALRACEKFEELAKPIQEGEMLPLPELTV